MRFILWVVLFCFSSTYASYIWEEDFSVAVKKSGEDTKALLLFFIGSDWSGPSMQLKDKVLNCSSFNSKLVQEFRCLIVDFPKHTLISDQLKAHNQELKDRFKILEFPQLLMLDCTGKEIMRMGYCLESAPQLIDELLNIKHSYEKLCEGLQALPEKEETLRYLYQLASTLKHKEGQTRVLQSGVEKEIPFFLLERYRLCKERGEEATLLREKLLKSQDSQVHFTMAVIDFQHKASTIQDPYQVIEPLQAYLDRFGEEDSQNVWRIEMMIAQFYLNADKWTTALEHAQVAYDTAPTQMRGNIKQSLHYIQEHVR